MKSRNKIIDLIEDMNRKDKFALIFRWHNALEIERLLNEEVNDGEFTFVPQDMKGPLSFMNNNEEVVIISDEGSILSTHVELSPLFERNCQLRLIKTKTMLEGLGV